MNESKAMVEQTNDSIGKMNERVNRQTGMQLWPECRPRQSSDGRGFHPQQEWWGIVLLQGQLSALSLNFFGGKYMFHPRATATDSRATVVVRKRAGHPYQSVRGRLFTAKHAYMHP